MTESRPTSGESPGPILSPEFLHDLRTPLNHILGYSEMLLEQAEQEGQSSYVPDLTRIQGAGQQLLALLNRGALHTQVGMTPVADPSPGLPSARPQSVSPAGEPGTPSESENARPWILVVDDNYENRDLLARRLRNQQYNVVTAEDGRQAMESLHTQAFDLLLLDIMIPEIDGYEVLRQIKADETLRHVSVIMISALDELDSVVRCIEMGADDYLPKPFEPALLKARIGACLEKKRAHDREAILFGQLEQNVRRLQELETLRNSLTHMIIHDLRTPLTSVISGMQMVQVVGELNSDQQEMLEIALAGGSKLLNMINGLLDVDKMESGSMQLDYSLLNADALVTSAVDQVVQLAKNKGLTLVKKIAADLPAFEGDEDILRRTLVNLIGNAIKFTPAGGTVTVAADRNGDSPSLLFSVCDTGDGIPADAFDRIFEKFGQVTSRQSGAPASTGLGLTFSKLAVEAHRGKIGVESLPGEGSTFSFTIPLTQNG
ncbi:MAG: hypothetical protein C4320_01745 [Armatimonadota bacterium]